ncbi:MAG: helix-turn-helix transcriptional regulator [Rhodospirillales bacterium]|nr:helix-turn-helix transcriptional regulator [Rhodospirillales bacterium]
MLAEDMHINARVRVRRLELKLTQLHLALDLGISASQIAKYETGVDRVSAGRLFQIAVSLQTPIAWFYEGLPLLKASSSLPFNGRKRWQRELSTVANPAES